MNKISEFFLDVCFIREQELDNNFKSIIDEHLQHIFSGKVTWETTGKQEKQLDIVMAEVKGIGNWIMEQDIVAYLEEKSSPQFMSWIQGYRIQVETKDSAACCHCGKSEIG